LSDLRGHSPTASLFKCDFSYSCAAVDMVSTDIARRMVPLRHVVAELLFVDIIQYHISDYRFKQFSKMCDVEQIGL